MCAVAFFRFEVNSPIIALVELLCSVLKRNRRSDTRRPSLNRSFIDISLMAVWQASPRRFIAATFTRETDHLSARHKLSACSRKALPKVENRKSVAVYDCYFKATVSVKEQNRCLRYLDCTETHTQAYANKALTRKAEQNSSS